MFTINLHKKLPNLTTALLYEYMIIAIRVSSWYSEVLIQSEAVLAPRDVRDAKTPTIRICTPA